MLSGLAGKLFGTITNTNSNKMEDSGDEGEVVVATASQDQELSDSEEWVLLDDDDISDRGSILDELELVVNNSSPPNNNDDSSSSSLNFSPNSDDGWNVEPPPCFQNRRGDGGEKEQQQQQKGKNKYKNTTKHKNPNLQRSIQKQHQQKTKDFRSGGNGQKRPPPPSSPKVVVAEMDDARPVNDFDDVMDVSVLENMLIERPAPAIRAVRKCADRTSPDDGVLRPLTSNKNQAAITPTAPTVAEKAAPAHRVSSANTTDRPLRPPPFRRQVKVAKPSLSARQAPAPAAEDDKKENKPPQPAPSVVPAPAKKVASKSNLSTYVITGLSVCAMKPCPAGGTAAAALTLAQQPPPPLQLLQDKRVAAAAGAPHFNRRGGMKRQNFTVYDASLFGKGKQRKDRIKNFSGRSNDRRRQ